MQLDKRNKAILLLTLVLFVLLPFDFVWGQSALEHLAFEYDEVTSVLFYIYYISVIVTAVAAVYNRYDMAKLSSLVSLILIVVLIVQSISIQYLDWIFRVMGCGTLYVVASGGLVFFCNKEVE